MKNFAMGVTILILLQLSLPFFKRYPTNEELTYNKDIKPIFTNRCSTCHNSNWPDKNWMDYKTAFKNKDKIKMRVQNQTMPPGNTTDMTMDERSVVIQWVDNGGKE